MKTANDIFKFAIYWIILGIASSIGFGTGLHTFVLYLGPWIAKFTMAANECGHIPLPLPSKYNFSHFEKCMPLVQSPENTYEVSVLQIYFSVIFEAFLWGLGTAIGELPPYLVAKLASMAGKKEEELEELEHSEQITFMGRMKKFLYIGVRKHAFIVVLLGASIPNPLFDLAGLTCGHFLIPFKTFFFATFIGKAVIKVSIQTIFIIVMFSKKHAEALISLIETKLPFLQNSISGFIQKWKQQFFNPPESLEKAHWIQKVWEIIITVMIAYFIISCINSLVQNYAAKIQSKAEKINDSKKDK